MVNPTKPAPTAGPMEKRLKKGELLFSEGDTSRAMYLLKSGVIRVFKKKGESSIEIDTIHSGQILGELAFLDGNPRSASGEALTDCHLMEISGVTFQHTLGSIPDWLKMLLKTIVGRLRTAGTRIRQLESASSSVNYAENGKSSGGYLYLGTPDVLKTCSAILLAASRHGKVSAEGLETKNAWIHRYANQIMGIPIAKIATMIDVLNEVEIVVPSVDASATSPVIVKDIEFLEKLISYINEENLLEASKRHDLSARGFNIMDCIGRHLMKFSKEADATKVEINIAAIRATEISATQKEPFRIDDLQELVKLGYASTANIKSADEIVTQVNYESFLEAYRLQKAMQSIAKANEQKRGASSGAKAA